MYIMNYIIIDIKRENGEWVNGRIVGNRGFYKYIC